jgi:hypothetical protein
MVHDCMMSAAERDFPFLRSAARPAVVHDDLPCIELTANLALPIVSL